LIPCSRTGSITSFAETNKNAAEGKAIRRGRCDHGGGDAVVRPEADVSAVRLVAILLRIVRLPDEGDLRVRRALGAQKFAFEVPGSCAIPTRFDVLRFQT
jgi:hypothetical protein